MSQRLSMRNDSPFDAICGIVAAVRFVGFESNLLTGVQSARFPNDSAHLDAKTTALRWTRVQSPFPQRFRTLSLSHRVPDRPPLDSNPTQFPNDSAHLAMAHHGTLDTRPNEAAIPALRATFYRTAHMALHTRIRFHAWKHTPKYRIDPPAATTMPQVRCTTHNHTAVSCHPDGTIPATR